jgi:hypothetical protein
MVCPPSSRYASFHRLRFFKPDLESLPCLHDALMAFLWQFGEANQWNKEE